MLVLAKVPLRPLSVHPSYFPLPRKQTQPPSQDHLRNSMPQEQQMLLQPNWIVSYGLKTCFPNRKSPQDHWIRAKIKHFLREL